MHKRKTNEKGEVNRYKARLVARGFAQKEYDSFHTNETFAHVVDRNSLRTILSVAASNNLKVYSFDISNAYLQAKFTYFRDRIMYCPREVVDHIDEVKGGKAEH